MEELNQLFFYRQRRPFFTATGRFLNRGGCFRHAVHGVGGDGDDKEENLFSDWRHCQSPKGEADSSAMAFCVYINVLQEYLLID